MRRNHMGSRGSRTGKWNSSALMDSLSKVSVAFSQTRGFILQLFWVFLTLTFTSSSHLMHIIQYHGKHPNNKAWNCWSCLVQTKQASQVYYEFALLATPQLAVTQRMSVFSSLSLFHQSKKKKGTNFYMKKRIFFSHKIVFRINDVFICVIFWQQMKQIVLQEHSSWSSRPVQDCDQLEDHSNN